MDDELERFEEILGEKYEFETSGIRENRRIIQELEERAEAIANITLPLPPPSGYFIASGMLTIGNFGFTTESILVDPLEWSYISAPADSQATEDPEGLPPFTASG